MLCNRCKKEILSDAVFCPYCGKKQSSESRKALKRANGTGTVYKLQGRRRKPWVAAKNKVIIGYYERKTDAIEALESLSLKNVNERYNMTFKDVFFEWKQEYYNGLSKIAAYRYDNAFEIYESLHDRKFRNLRTQDFQNIINQHLDMSYSSLSMYKLLATQLSKWAMREEIISTNFAQFIKIPKQQKKEKEIFSEADICKLQNDDSETAKIILMLIYTGMRISELFSLKLSDYHETYVIGGEKTEAGKNRLIPIRPEGRKYFAYFASIATDERLLSGYSGARTVNNFRSSHYYPLLEKLEIQRKTPHSTRHTYASWAVEAGMQPEVLQKILGHSNYSTTVEIYVHSDIEQLVSAVENC